MELQHTKTGGRKPIEIIARKERKENGCFDYSKRLFLEGKLQGKMGFPNITSRTELARIFNCARNTIYSEIARGTVEHTRSDLSIVMEYNVDGLPFHDDRA